MRIKETKVYPFDELTEDAQEKAVENLAEINVDYGWWDATYDDAYYQIQGGYTLVFFYDNLCSGGFCADVVIHMQKISDSTASIPLKRSREIIDKAEYTSISSWFNLRVIASGFYFFGK